jgi:hypothetical protein
MENSEGKFNPSPGQPEDPEQKQGTQEARKFVSAEKFIDVLVGANVSAVDLYLTNHKFSPWVIEDLLTLAREYQESPAYKAKFLEVFAPHIDQMIVKGSTRDIRKYLPACMHQRLLGRGVSALAAEHGIIRGEDIDSATDSISSFEAPMGWNVSQMPNIWKKRQSIYFKLKEKLGEESMQKLQALSLAGSAVCWLAINRCDYGRRFTPADVIAFAEQLSAAGQLPKDEHQVDDYANDNLNSYTYCATLLLRGDGRWQNEFEKVQIPVLRDRLQDLSELNRDVIQDIYERQKKMGEEFQKYPTSDLTHIKTWIPGFGDFEASKIPDDAGLKSIAKMIKQKPGKF